MTTWMCGSTAHMRSMVSRPSQPGGMRMSTIAIAYGRPALRASVTLSTPSRPWYAASSSNCGQTLPVGAPPKTSASRIASASCELCAASTLRTLRKSAWIAALSSTINTRRLMTGVALDTVHAPRLPWQLEHEACAVAEPFARGAQAAAELLRGDRPAVQAEAMPGLARRKAMVEQPRHVVGRDADAVVDDRDAHAAWDLLGPQRQQLVLPAGLVAGVLRVAHEVDEDLQHLVLVDGDRCDFGELAAQRHAVARERAGVQAQAVLDEIGDIDRFGDAAELGVALLHRDRLLDVLKVGAQGAQLLQCSLLVGDELGSLLLQQIRDAAEAVDLRLLDAIREQARGDVDAVQDVADVVQDIRGDFRHAGLARGRHQLLVDALELEVGGLPLSDVLPDRDRAKRLAAGSREAPRVGDDRARTRMRRGDDELEVADDRARQGLRQRELVAVHRGGAIGEERVHGHLLERRQRPVRILRQRKQFLRRMVRMRDRAVRVAGEQRERHVFDDRLDQRLLAQQLGGEVLALRDVAEELDRAVRRAGAFAHERGREPYPHGMAVPVAVALLVIDELGLAVPESLEGAQALGEVLGVRQVGDGP